MNQVLWGASAALSGVAALFFTKFWWRTREALFAALAGGFAVLALHWALLGVLNPGNETRHYLYLARFVAFALFIAGVASKNRRSDPPVPPSTSIWDRRKQPLHPPGSRTSRR